jgi:hypothetical protein
MVPEPVPEGEIDHVTFVFAAPLTVAESCQFAPTPMGQGFVVEAAQPEFAMATVTGCGGGVLDDEEPPHAASERRPRKGSTRHQIRKVRLCNGHLPNRFELYRES